MPGLLPGLIGSVSNDAVIAFVGVIIVFALGVLLEANRRWNNRLEGTVREKAEQASKDTKVVADAVVDVRGAVRETNGRLHDARERLARLEGSAEFIITRQSNVARTASATQAVVEDVKTQLDTKIVPTIGELAGAGETVRLEESNGHHPDDP